MLTVGSERTRLEASMHNPTLTAEDVAILAIDREFIPAVLKARFPETQLTGSPADLSLMQQIYDGGPYTNDAVSEVIALGTAFGDVLANTLGLSWVRYCDEEGEELALRYESTDIVVFPRTMLLTRMEEGAPINLVLIYDEVCALVRQRLAAAN